MAKKRFKFLTLDGLEAIEANQALIQQDITVKHSEVDADATAVELTRQFLVELRAIIEQLHSDVDADATAVETTRQLLANLQATIEQLHADVDADATAVELTRQDLVARQADITAKHSEVDADATAVELTRQFLLTLKASMESLHSEADADATAVELTRQYLVALRATIEQLHADVDADATAVETTRQLLANLLATIQQLHSDVDADAVAVEITRQLLVTLEENVVARHGNIVTRHDDIVAKHGDVGTKYTDLLIKYADILAKHTQVNNLVNQAAAIVHEGSTDMPTIPPIFAWNAEMYGEPDPSMEIAFTGNLTVLDHRGRYRSAGQAARMLDYDPTFRCLGIPAWEGRTNMIRNPTMEGGVTGTIGQGGSSPSNWTASGAAMTYDFVSKGVEFGLRYAEYRISGTNNSGADAFPRIKPEALTTASNLAVSAGETVTFTFFTRITNNVYNTAVSGLLYFRDGAGNTMAGVGATFRSANLTPAFSEYTIQHTTLAGTSGFANVEWGPNIPNGQSVDVTIRFYAPMLEKGTFKTPFIPNNAGVTNVTPARSIITPSILGQAFNQFFNPLEGTILVEFYMDRAHGKGAVPIMLPVSGANTTERLWIEYGNTGNISLRGIHPGGMNFVQAFGTVQTGRNRAVFSYKLGRMTGCLNGGALVSSPSLTTMPTMTRINFGHPGFSINGTYSDFAYWNTVLPDAHQVALSRL